MTIEELKDHTKVTDSLLDTEIEERDMILLAVHFDNVETLSVQLRLSTGDKREAQDIAFRFDIRTGVDKALRLWRKANPSAATYRALVEIALRIGVDGTIAEEVCKSLVSKCGKRSEQGLGRGRRRGLGRGTGSGRGLGRGSGHGLGRGSGWGPGRGRG